MNTNRGKPVSAATPAAMRLIGLMALVVPLVCVGRYRSHQQTEVDQPATRTAEAPRASSRAAGADAVPWCQGPKRQDAADTPDSQTQSGLLVGAYWYPWYGPGRRHWQDGYRNTPLLGEYHSADPAVIDQQIAWALDHGIDFWVASWWGPDSPEERTIAAFLRAEHAGRLPFCVLYESTGRLHAAEGRIDLDDARNRRLLVEDLRHLAHMFFTRPNYLHINQRPVVFLYLTRIFTGNVEPALAAARAAVQDAVGKVPYLVGDEVYWHEPSRQRLTWFDAVTAYNMHTSVPGIAERFAEKVAVQYQRWSGAAQQAGVGFVPSVLPGFDDTAVRPEAQHPVIPRSLELFREQLAAALALARGKPAMVLITSWNEWHEDTSIEPAREYGFEYLNAVRHSRQQWQAGEK